MNPGEVRLDRNERLRPPPELVALLPDLPAESLNVYPATDRLEEALALRLGVDRARVLVTAGGDDAIDRVCRLVGGGGRIVSVTPTFEMFPFFGRLAGAEFVGFRDLEDPLPQPVLDASCDGAGAVIAVSPHNPTGIAIPTERLVSAATAIGPDRLLVVDQAYVEFADEDPVGTLLALPNVIVVRTLSKAWGMAGARVGCVAGPAALIDRLRVGGPPFPLAGASIWLAERALDLGRVVTDEYVFRVRAERRELTALLETLGGRTWPSQANFVLARFADAQPLAQRLESAGFRIRRFPGMPDLIRITLPGDPEVFSRLRTALMATHVHSTAGTRTHV